MADEKYVPRLKTHYLEVIRPKLMERLGYKNPMQLPRLDKIVLNMGVGEAVNDTKKVKSAADELQKISGQKPIITHARITWAGQFNMGKPGNDNWRPFTAIQEFVPGAPGFVWNARIAMLPGVPVLVRDSLVDSRGSMRGAIFGLLSVVNAEGTSTLATGALQRYLGEATFFPTALLPRQGVSWTAIDDARAQATITAGEATVSLEFRFDAEGRNVSVYAPDRFYDDGTGQPVAAPWEGRNLQFGERAGVTVPMESMVQWLLPSGPFPYWWGRPIHIEYRFGAPE